MLRSTPLPPCLASERKPAVGILGCSAPELPELAGISLRKAYRRVLASARGFPRLPEKKRHAVEGKASFRVFLLRRIIRGAMAHYYLYVQCKTEGCPSKLFLLHFEFADVPHIPIDYPEAALYLSLPCPSCGQTYRYTPEDVKTTSSAEAHHPEGWRPILPFPPEKPPDTN